MRLFQPLAFSDPKAMGVNTSDILATERSSMAHPEGQHERVTTASMQRPLKRLRSQLSTNTASERDTLLMPRKLQSRIFHLETENLSNPCTQLLINSPSLMESI